MGPESLAGGVGAGLGLTAAFQLVIVLTGGSVGLLADTIHNACDALTAIPLGIVFVLGRRAATRRYTDGYGRAEDVAGTIIVGMIFLSVLVAAYESVQKVLHLQPLHNLGWVMVAAIVGCVGNEAVAVLRLRVGRQIGSAALIADGQHARIDGLTSLAALIGAATCVGRDLHSYYEVLAACPLKWPLISGSTW